MKNIIRLCVFVSLIAATHNGFSQEVKKNIMSLSIGVWERDVTRSSDNLNHKFGPVAAINYQRILTQHIAFRSKLFGGGIYNNDFNENIRHFGVSAGIIVTPFGDKFPNLKIGFSPMYVLEIVQNEVDGNRTAFNSSWWGFEIPVLFNVVDKSKWYLGLGADLQFGKNIGGVDFCMFTVSPMISYGLKF